jgi:hypothetical protein
VLGGFFLISSPFESGHLSLFFLNQELKPNFPEAFVLWVVDLVDLVDLVDVVGVVGVVGVVDVMDVVGVVDVMDVVSCTCSNFLVGVYYNLITTKN